MWKTIFPFWSHLNAWDLIADIAGLLCTFTLAYFAIQFILSLLNQ